MKPIWFIIMMIDCPGLWPRGDGTSQVRGRSSIVQLACIYMISAPASFPTREGKILPEVV